MNLIEAKNILKINGYLLEDKYMDDMDDELDDIINNAEKNSLSYNGPKVKIGNQVWASKNLDVDDGGEGIYEHNGEYYYTWEAAVRVADKILGWHLPTKKEFVTLIKNVGGEDAAGKALKSTKGWKKDGNGTDNFGFNALPAGDRFGDWGFYSVGYRAYFWSSTESDCKGAYIMYLNFDGCDAYLRDEYKEDGFSVRLIKD